MNLWLTKLQPVTVSRTTVFVFLSCAITFFFLAIQIETAQAHANLLRSQPRSNESVDVLNGAEFKSISICFELTFGS